MKSYDICMMMLVYIFSIKHHNHGELIPPVVRKCIEHLRLCGKLYIFQIFFWRKAIDLILYVFNYSVDMFCPNVKTGFIV